MTESLIKLLLRLSEAGEPALLWGRQAKPYLGRDFERLLASGILVEGAPATEWDVCHDCECDQDSRLIQEINGRFIAACPYNHHSDTVLDAQDLRSFRIVMPGLVREIAVASGLSRVPTQVMPSTWHLGQTSSNREIFIVISTAGTMQSGLVATLRTISRSLPITIVMPTLPAADELHFAEAGIHTVGVSDAIGSRDGGLPFAIDLARLEPAAAFAPRLLISRSNKSVALDGVSKVLSEQNFKLLVLLAEHALKSPGVVDNRRIEDHLWGSNIHRITSGVRDPVRALRDALAAGSTVPKTVRALIGNRRDPNGYRLGLVPEDILFVA